MPTFVWARDKSTGHLIDVPKEQLDAFPELFEVVKGYEVNEGHRAVAREPKFNVPKGGNSPSGAAAAREA